MRSIWDGSQESGPTLTEEMVRHAESELGCLFPASYLDLLRTQNGGYPLKDGFLYPDGDPSEPDDYVRITRFISISDFGNPLYTRALAPEWGYPTIGPVIAETDAGGHNAILFDYSTPGKDGEPRVVLVCTETVDGEPEIRELTADFETFFSGMTTIPDLADDPE